MRNLAPLFLLACAMLSALVLAGCAGRASAIADTAVEEARAVEDAKARAAINAQCATGIGALQRGFTPEVQEYVWKACGALNSASPAQASDLIQP